jgi:hypothetical protein
VSFALRDEDVDPARCGREGDRRRAGDEARPRYPREAVEAGTSQAIGRSNEQQIGPMHPTDA